MEMVKRICQLECIRELDNIYRSYSVPERKFISYH